MATPKPPRRPVAGSRTPSSAPRKIAGRGRVTPPPTDPDAASAPVTEPVDQPVEEPAEAPVAGPVAGPDESGQEPTRPASDAPASRILVGATTTKVLAAALAVLVLVGAAELFYLLRDPLQPSEDRLVTTTELDTELAVDEATRQLTEILEFSWRDYDAQLEDALSRIDGEFRDKWRQTAEDTRAKVLAQKADYSVEIIGSGVIEAGPDEVKTLVFLDQNVFRGQGKSRVGPETYSFRIEVTTVRKGDSWLVTDITTL